MKPLRGVLIAFATFVGLVVLVVALFAGWMLVSGSRIEKQATAFCDGVALGSSVASLEAQAQAAGAIYLPGSTHPHVVRFAGWGLAECRLTVTQGRITAKQVLFEEYD